jgi:hypothetical protein
MDPVIDPAMSAVIGPAVGTVKILLITESIDSGQT